MVKSLHMVLDVTSQTLQDGGSAGEQCSPLLLQEKLLEEGLSIWTKREAIARELPQGYISAPRFPPVLWWFCSSSPAPLIHMVLVAAVLPTNNLACTKEEIHDTGIWCSMGL